MLLCLVMVGNGIRPASAAGPAKQTARQVWTGADVDGSGKVSVDGRYLSFTDQWTGDLVIPRSAHWKESQPHRQRLV
jgi:hypothetical protein